MPASEPSIPAIVVEAVLNLVGLILLWRWVLSPRARREPKLTELTAWDVTPSDFLLYLLLVVLGGFGLESICAWVFHHQLQTDEGRLLVGGGALQAGVLLGVIAYRTVFSHREGVPRPGRWRGLLIGAAIFLVVLPLINLVNMASQAVLDWCGVPVVRQEMVDLLANDHSWVVRGTLILLASVGAPVMEEIVFRAGLFRYLRTRLPRWAALVLPSALFAASHANLAAFVPFLLLGIALSLAYERTGRIGTAIVIHSLFNLNTVAMVLLGFNA